MAEGTERAEGGRRGVWVIWEVLGGFSFFFFPEKKKSPGSCTNTVCLCVLKYGVMGTCKVTSLCVLSLGRDYCLLLGCVASSLPYHSRCWTGCPCSVWTSLTNTAHTHSRNHLATPESMSLLQVWLCA